MSTRVRSMGAPLAGAVLLLALAGCANGRHSAAATAAPTRWPAGVAGGACQLLDFDVVAAAVGVSFDVAAAAQQGGTYTCVLQQQQSSFPDLTLAVTPTAADVSTFRGTVTPKGAATVSDLGRAGYSTTVPASGGAGPAIEVGWLAGNARLLVLRYRLAPGADPAPLAALTPKVVELARKVDLYSA